jgi:hypothetical protein
VAWRNVGYCRLAAERIGDTRSKPHEEPLSIMEKDERYFQSIKFKGNRYVWPKVNKNSRSVDKSKFTSVKKEFTMP